MTAQRKYFFQQAQPPPAALGYRDFLGSDPMSSFRIPLAPAFMVLLGLIPWRPVKAPIGQQAVPVNGDGRAGMVRPGRKPFEKDIGGAFAHGESFFLAHLCATLRIPLLPILGLQPLHASWRNRQKHRQKNEE